jgi:lauroyl/myristoyl acyltransferase
VNKFFTTEKESTMKIITSLITFITVLFLLLPLQSSYAAEEAYGWNIMTQQERMQHRETMRNLKTQEEQERYRMEHQKKMQERAKERGLTLPDSPQERDRMRDQMRDQTGSGSGMGGGSGSGMGGKGK